MPGWLPQLLIWGMAAWLPVSAGISVWRRRRAAKNSPLPSPTSDRFLAAFAPFTGAPFACLWFYLLPITPLTFEAESAAGWLLLSLGLAALISAAAAWKWPLLGPDKRGAARVSSVGAAILLAANIAFVVWVFSVPGRASDAVQAVLPFEGEWRCASGGRWSWTNRHHGNPPSQNCAADFVAPGARDASFGQVVLSPVDGEVESSRADQPDEEGSPADGNFVGIRTKDGARVWLAHLKADSVSVKPGDAVKAGQAISLCGYSGAATFPHLHVHAERDGRAAPILYRDGILKRGGIRRSPRAIFPVRGDLIRAKESK